MSTTHSPSHVPWFDLTRQYQQLRPAIQQALEETLSTGTLILGPAVERFETDFARYLDVKHCIGLNSGTSALHLALLACNIGPGDEVITTPVTWISTVSAISHVGATPVLVDIEPDYHCLDPNAVEAAITPRTKAILPVHLFGQAADVQSLQTIAARRGLVMIEDACQAHGGTYHGRPLGTFGRVNCFSFYPGKNLGAYGEAGAAVTDDDVLAERIRSLRNHGQVRRRVHAEIGFNMRMEGVQGAVLATKLPYLDSWVEARRQIAWQYTQVWRGLSALRLPAMRPGTEHAWHLYSVRVEDRDAFQTYVAGQGVQTTVHYPTPVHLQPAYRHLGHGQGAFPNAEALCKTQVTLPLFPEMTASEVERVQAAVGSWAASKDISRAA
jgi:dTDP-4-amino-4,6-dideoxygalactose transaminase